jgi:uncharacterized protein YdiU (UPF0061 family)
LYTEYYEAGMRNKLGLKQEKEVDADLFAALFNAMEGQVDFTNFFRALCDFDETGDNQSLSDRFVERIQFDQWADDYAARLKLEGSDRATRRTEMLSFNPKYILRNYMVQTAIVKAENKDYSEVDILLRLLRTPFDEQPGMESYAKEPPEWAKTLELSCSS